MKKIILCDGDSWTAGDIVDPNIFGDKLEHVNHPKNTEYRLPRVWPGKLEKLIGIETDNISIAGSSNDAIVRRTLRRVIQLLETYKPEEIFVIIGWSSPERKDFYYNGKWESWETLYPAQLSQDFPDMRLKNFYEIYLDIFWNEEEYIERYIQQNLLLHHFLNSHNIKHLFFDAFYEKEDGMFKDVDIEETFYNFHSLRSDKIGGDRIRELEFSGNKYLIDEFLKLREKIFKKESFRRYIGFKDMKLWDGVHPSEEAHEKWAQELNRELRGKI
tara:strand:- start:186 stop:1004 length:819 start_codon:yes stop_codon:yes gene_type:complete